MKTQNREKRKKDGSYRVNVRHACLFPRARCHHFQERCFASSSARFSINDETTSCFDGEQFQSQDGRLHIVLECHRVLLGVNMGDSKQSTPNESLRESSKDSQPDLPEKDEVPTKIQEALEDAHNWDFDVIQLEHVSGCRPLKWLGRLLFDDMEVGSSLHVTQVKVARWLVAMEKLYQDQPYHNSTHAADVLQASVYFLKKLRPKGIFSSMDEAVIMVSAVIHDADHPGRSSRFLSAQDHDLALTYNDISILENHHVSVAFKTTLGNASTNIFSNLPRPEYRATREQIIALVLATDMAQHSQHLEEFILVSQEPRKQGGFDDRDTRVIMQMLLKCADLSNCARALDLSKKWAYRICAEFWEQADDEVRLELPVSNRAFLAHGKEVIPRSQVGFIDSVVRETFRIWSGFAALSDLEEQIERNYEY